MGRSFLTQRIPLDDNGSSTGRILSLFFLAFLIDTTPVPDEFCDATSSTVVDLHFSFTVNFEVTLRFVFSTTFCCSIFSSACNFRSIMLISLSMSSASANLFSDIAFFIASFLVEILSRRSNTVGKLLRILSNLTINDWISSAFWKFFDDTCNACIDVFNRISFSSECLDSKISSFPSSPIIG